MNHQGLPDRAPAAKPPEPWPPCPPEERPKPPRAAEATSPPPAAGQATLSQQDLAAEVIRACEKREPYVLQLLVPVRFGSDEFRELTFRRPSADVLEAWNIGEKRYGAYLALAARLCGLDPAAFKKLDIDDANRAVMVASFFSGVGLPTGGP